MQQNKNGGQMSEAFLNCAFLAFSGGLQDAYTYNTRDGVFSNAQTGNIVLLSQYFIKGEWQLALRYLFPLAAFTLGVFAAQMIHGRSEKSGLLHWRQKILLMEIAVLAAVGFMPQSLNGVAAVLVSFSCAMQVQAFRKVSGYSYASTMCVGNLRSASAALAHYRQEKNPACLKQAGYYSGIILFFAIGAGIGGNLSAKYGIHVIWLSAFCLMISFLLMFAQSSCVVKKSSESCCDKPSAIQYIEEKQA